SRGFGSCGGRMLISKEQFFCASHTPHPKWYQALALSLSFIGLCGEAFRRREAVLPSPRGVLGRLPLTVLGRLPNGVGHGVMPRIVLMGMLATHVPAMDVIIALLRGSSVAQLSDAIENLSH